MSLPEEYREKVRKIVDELLASDFSDDDLEKTAERLTQCALEIMSSRGLDYGDEEIQTIMSLVRDGLSKVRENMRSENLSGLRGATTENSETE